MGPDSRQADTRTVSGFITASCPLPIVERVILHERRAAYVVDPNDRGTGSVPEVPPPHPCETDW
jgi:hypothetical protein